MEEYHIDDLPATQGFHWLAYSLFPVNNGPRVDSRHHVSKCEDPCLTLFNYILGLCDSVYSQIDLLISPQLKNRPVALGGRRAFQVPGGGSSQHLRSLSKLSGQQLIGWPTAPTHRFSSALGCWKAPGYFGDFHVPVKLGTKVLQESSDCQLEVIVPSWLGYTVSCFISHVVYLHLMFKPNFRSSQIPHPTTPLQHPTSAAASSCGLVPELLLPSVRPDP